MCFEGERKAKLYAMEVSIMRRVAGVTRLNHNRNEDSRHRLQQRSVMEIIRELEERELESDVGTIDV